MKAISSNEAINYFKKNIPSKHILSMFIGGSIPKKLVPESNLDIFIVAKGKYKNEFFDNVVRIMDKFIKKSGGVTYSLLRGPLKYKSKGLIHLSIYVEEKGKEQGNREQFSKESNHIIKNLMKKGKIIKGKPIIKLVDLGRLKEKKVSLEDLGKSKKSIFS